MNKILNQILTKTISIYNFKSWTIMFNWLPFAFLTLVSISALITRGITTQIVIYAPIFYAPHAEAIFIWSTTFLIYFYPRFKTWTIPLFMLIYGWDEVIWNLSYAFARQLDGYNIYKIYAGINSYKLTLVFITMLLGYYILKKKNINLSIRYSIPYFSGFLLMWLVFYIGYLDVPIVEDIVTNTLTPSNIYYEILWQFPILGLFVTQYKGYHLKLEIGI